MTDVWSTEPKLFTIWPYQTKQTRPPKQKQKLSDPWTRVKRKLNRHTAEAPCLQISATLRDLMALTDGWSVTIGRQTSGNFRNALAVLSSHSASPGPAQRRCGSCEVTEHREGKSPVEPH